MTKQQQSEKNKKKEKMSQVSVKNKSFRCEAKTKNGKQCRNRTTSSTHMCHLHRNMTSQKLGGRDTEKGICVKNETSQDLYVHILIMTTKGLLKTYSGKDTVKVEPSKKSCSNTYSALVRPKTKSWLNPSGQDSYLLATTNPQVGIIDSNSRITFPLTADNSSDLRLMKDDTNFAVSFAPTTNKLTIKPKLVLF